MKVLLFRHSLVGSLILVGLLAAPDAFGDILLDGLFVNNTFTSNQAGGCPTGWTCGGSPAPGFSSYLVTPNEYAAGFSPIGGYAATSPTYQAGSGSMYQSSLGGLKYMPGETYTVDLWVGTPQNVPAIVGLGDGIPAGPAGVLTIYFTWSPGVALLDGAFDGIIPEPGTWALDTFNFTPSSGDWDYPVGFEIFLGSDPPSGGSGANRIANFQLGTVPDPPVSIPEPGSFLFAGLGILGLAAGACKHKRLSLQNIRFSSSH